MYLDRTERIRPRVVIALVFVAITFAWLGKDADLDVITTALIGMATWLLGFAIGWIERLR